MTAGDKARIQEIDTEFMVNQAYTYDVEGRVSKYTQKIKWRESYPMEVDYLYDSLDRVKEVKYPAQYGIPAQGGNPANPRKIVAHTYDTTSRLTAMTYNGNQQAGNIVYNAADQTTQMKIGAAGTNQVTEDYTFDPQTGLLTNQQAIKSGASTPFINLSYEYNRNNSVGSLNGKTGHLTKIIDHLSPGNAKNREYEFDVLGRLTKAKGGPTGNLWDQTYSYDRYGNRTNVTASGVAADSSPMPLDGVALDPLTPNVSNLTYDNATNRITSSVEANSFQYDVNGNLIKAMGENGVWVKYEYDAANRLNIIRKDDAGQTQLERFQYDSTNARVQSHDFALDRYKTHLNTGGTSIAEFTEFTVGLPTWTKSYTYLGGSQLSTITPNGQNEYIEFNHPDRLGTKVVTNQAAGTSSEQAHLPFGRKLDAESTLTTNNKRFTSYDRSEKTSLDYAVNRTYDSKLGRFTQVDPIGMQAASLAAPQTLNMYSYCINDPVNYTDPSGLFWGFLKKLFKWIMVAIAVIVAIVTIISAPFTLAGILGMISAGAGAASSVLGALGYTKAARIFGLIAVLTGFGSLIAGKLGVGNFAASDTGGYKEAALFGIFSGVGAIANSFAQTRDRRRRAERGSPTEIRMTFFRLYGKDFNKCLKQAFGKDYAKIGKQTFGNSPVIDATLTSAQTGALSGTGAATGGSDPFYGKHGKVVIESATYNSRSWNSRKAVFGTFAHETANILDMRTNPNEPAATYGKVYGDPNDAFDDDTGAKVERCLFGSLQYPAQTVP